MGRFVERDVVVIRFPFTDLTDRKRRPALVLATLDMDDSILCQITTKPWHEPAVEITEEDFVEGGLPQDSYARPSRVFTANEEIIIEGAGTITERTFQDVRTELITLLKG